MSTIILTLTLNLPPEVTVETVSEAVNEAAFEQAEHVRKCDCAWPYAGPDHGCELQAQALDALQLALAEEVK